MNRPLALLCSPHPGGVTDTVAGLFAEGMAEAGAEMRMAALRDYALTPCKGCGACAQPPHACVLAAPPMPGGSAVTDQAEELFGLLRQAPLVLLAAPIYFYALPAHFKALIDRSQRFWAEHCHPAAQSKALPRPPVKPVLTALSAGRSRGKQLFAGSLLTLKYFLAPLHADIRETRLLRGLETKSDLQERPAVTAALRAWGHDWGRRLVAGHCPRSETSPALAAHAPEQARH